MRDRCQAPEGTVSQWTRSAQKAHISWEKSTLPGLGLGGLL